MAKYIVRSGDSVRTVEADEHKYEMLVVESDNIRSGYAVMKLLKEGKTVGTYRLDKIEGWHIQ